MQAKSLHYRDAPQGFSGLVTAVAHRNHMLPAGEAKWSMAQLPYRVCTTVYWVCTSCALIGAGLVPALGTHKGCPYVAEGAQIPDGIMREYVP